MRSNKYEVAFPLGTLLAAALLCATPALGQGTAVVTGTVIDSATRQPVADVVVTATSPNLQGEQVAVTDATGLYRVPQLPPGTYTLRLEKESYRPFARGDITLRLDTTTRVNVELLPDSIRGEDITVVGRAPTVDVGSTSTGVNVSSDFIRNIAVVRPGGKGSAARSFESLAIVAPGAQPDAYGTSINGTTSPENQYVIDGLSVNDPGFGINATPLSVEFIQEVNVITGGYMPEYGRATGGILNAVTKSGSNEFHGSVWGNIAPGALEGSPRLVHREGSTVTTEQRLWNLGDFGAELGGPILKDKLWFFVGVAPSFTRYQLERNLNAVQFDDAGNAQTDSSGFTVTQRIPGTQKFYFADQQSLQYLAKLTYLINQDHNISLSVYGTPTTSGGPRAFGIDPKTGATETSNIIGPFDTLASHYETNSTDVVAKWSSSFFDKRLLLDGTLGWHHMDNSQSPVDGTTIGTDAGLAGTPQTEWRRNPTLHTIADFEQLPAGAVGYCDPAGTPGLKCPVTDYFTGGPGFLGHDVMDRYQGRVVGTYLLNALGHHVIKAGADVEAVNFHRIKAFSGRYYYRESDEGDYFTDFREYGFIKAPDQVEISRTWDAVSRSTTIGGFIQDSWSILDLVTINAGIRYDTQTMWGADNQLALQFPNQFSPRIGIVYDFTQQGRSKLYANYARFYENALLDMIDREFPGERQVVSRHASAPNAVTGGPGCDPRDPVQAQDGGACRDPRNLLQLNSDVDPNRYWGITGGDKSPVDPEIKPQSSDEFVVGGEYEVFTDARAGISYTRRSMNDVVEDMSRDEATSYFVGNPGSGIAKDFPKATRDYDAVTVYLNKTFSDLWLAQASYTLSYLRGNYAGLYRPETGQLDPNINSDFDLISLLDNRTGPLQGDHTHQIKVFGAKEFVLSGTMSVNLGVTYTTRSGSPLNATGSHPVYGADEVFIIPRGAAGRLPWVHNFDGHLGFNYRFSKDNIVTASVDVFNIFNFQQVTARDERYTSADVSPLPSSACGGQPCTLSDLPKVGAAANPNFLNPTAYQAPRSIRFGARVSF